jgi:Sulfotransferase family
MWNALSASRRLVLGVERYGNLYSQRSQFTPECFVEERFFDCRPGDTFYSNLNEFNSYYTIARNFYASSQMVGDKIPLLYRMFDSLEEQFPSAKVIMMFRNIFDVAASYKVRAEDANDSSWDAKLGVNKAIEDWGKSLAAYNAYKDRLDILPIVYEDFFASQGAIENVLNFLGLEDGNRIRKRFSGLLKRAEQLEASRVRAMNLSEIFSISMDAPFDSYREIVKAARSLAHASGAEFSTAAEIPGN